ncbi:MAG: hypothetical protein JW873_06620 [Candidatus Saganbacteria bacterium]|nr:hypothetical protein [Candidatus Saganbacteria bacterium]
MTCEHANSNNKTVKNEGPADLEEKGRVKFFYHSPSSKLPIRDILNEQGAGPKTEPHIEIGAENYLGDCYQRYIRNFAKSREKYLFLMTRCRNKDLGDKNNKRFIVGYIEKSFSGERDNSVFIKGPVHMYSFDDSISTLKLKYSNRIRMKLVNEKDTRTILDHFNGKEDIVMVCVEAVATLDKNSLTCNKNACLFKKECLRRKILRSC